MQKTLGGDRLGSGKKMKVDLHGYNRSTHNLSYLWRSTMSAGTLVPFLTEVALPGDTFDINLDCDIKTHPTVGPLFGSYKVQLDIFQCPIRLYQAQLHNNKLGIGMNMAAIKLPQITLTAPDFNNEVPADIDNSQINPSCILSYLNIRGVGIVSSGDATRTRNFNAVPFLSYWDIYKNYYANKQEEIGAVIHTSPEASAQTIGTVTVGGPTNTIPQAPAVSSTGYTSTAEEIIVTFAGTAPDPTQIIFKIITYGGITQYLSLSDIALDPIESTATTLTTRFKIGTYGPSTILNWDYQSPIELPLGPPTVVTFPLANIDQMREDILAGVALTTPFLVNTGGLTPYIWPLTESGGGFPHMMQNQEGLAIKTYQSDLFNNWLNTETIDGTNGITEITAIDTTGGSFTLDTLNLSKKVYDMLNRIAVSGGSYDDWMDAVWTHDRYIRAETPMYQGGLIKELVFQEVVSNSQSASEGTTTQPLGTLAGKGIMSKKHKGGKITVKVDEPSYIIGIISLTPRIDYSQGNKWDTQLQTMDDFYKPALGEIGFQELITEQMAWFTTTKATGSVPWTTKSAGKQPAWINYMTNVNQVRGNFAVSTSEMFMTLNRRYEWNENQSTTSSISDLTTYIDPVKYNHIFAQTSIDAQNFWAQIAVDMTARRKMSAKIMPNL